MFLKTLPIVPVRPSTGQLPESGTVTSFFLPMLMEKGFGIPVRELEGDYLPAMKQRLEALCAAEPVADNFVFGPLSSVPNFQMQLSNPLRTLRPAPGKITSSHVVTHYTARELIDLMVLKDRFALDWIGLEKRDCERVPFKIEFIPYMSLLYGLEMMGVIAGIRYDYDVPVAGLQYPKHADVRTILVDRELIYKDPQTIHETQLSILVNLGDAQEIDADAEPLCQFFREAYHRKDSVKLRGLKYRSNTSMAHYTPGRDHPVAQVTVVQAID